MLASFGKASSASHHLSHHWHVAHAGRYQGQATLTARVGRIPTFPEHSFGRSWAAEADGI